MGQFLGLLMHGLRGFFEHAAIVNSSGETRHFDLLLFSKTIN